MGKLTQDIFNESCCDGGACSTEMSTQSCGCDMGCKPKPHYCARHEAERIQTIYDNAVQEPYFPKETPMNSGWNDLPNQHGLIEDSKNALDVHMDEVIDKTWNNSKKCKDWQDHVMNAVLGLGGEAGEVVDLHKKMFYHGDKDRSAELIEELGDLFYYLAKVMQLHGITMEECLAYNKKKLFKRYEVKA